MVEKDRDSYFLHGLNFDLDEVRGRILGTKPLPSFKEVFAEVRREESKQKVMLQNNQGLSHQNSTLATVNQGEALLKNQEREKKWYDHCKRPYHTKEICWKIHGKPTKWKPQNKREIPRLAYVVKISTKNKKCTNLNLSEKHKQTLYRLLNQGINLLGPSNPQPSTSIAFQDSSHYSLISRKLPKSVWMVNTGASNHMSSSADLMTNYTPRSTSTDISIENGTTSPWKCVHIKIKAKLCPTCTETAIQSSLC